MSQVNCPKKFAFMTLNLEQKVYIVLIVSIEIYNIVYQF